MDEIIRVWILEPENVSLITLLLILIASGLNWSWLYQLLAGWYLISVICIILLYYILGPIPEIKLDYLLLINGLVFFIHFLNGLRLDLMKHELKQKETEKLRELKIKD